jgi:hypothetical protein
MLVGEPDELVRSLEGLPVAAILTELTSHRFVGVNEQATEVFGMPAGELIGTDVLTRIDPRVAKRLEWRTQQWLARPSTATKCDAASSHRMARR